MTQAMNPLEAGHHHVALVGGGGSLRALALLQDYAAYDPAGRDLQPLVDLLDTHGTSQRTRMGAGENR